MVCFTSNDGFVWRTFTSILLCFLMIQKQKADLVTRQAKSCRGQPYTSPLLSKSRLCRCLHRPDYNDSSTSNFTSPPEDTYVLEVVEIDHGNFIPEYFPLHRDAICVYFGQAGSRIQQGSEFLTREFAVQALNEYGWPTGTWEVVKLKGSCLAPTSLLRVSIGNDTFYDHRECFDEDYVLGWNEGWYTESSESISDDNPYLLHFHNEFRGRYGLTALLKLNTSDVSRRPKKLKFVAEAVYAENDNSSYKITRIETATYNVEYDAEFLDSTGDNEDLIAATPSSQDDIELSLDFAYQVRTKSLLPPNDTCLEPPPPPPKIPMYAELSCGCFIPPRQPESFNLESGNRITHPRLNLTDNITDFEDRYPQDELSQFFSDYGHSYLYNPDASAEMDGLLVILYTFLPVYKGRKFREREFVIQDFRYDTGLPAGKFLDPFLDSEVALYKDACDEAVSERRPMIPDMVWTMPPFPAVGKCVDPYRDYDIPENKQPCYFHFHSDYFFVDCVAECEKPKYICAVWKDADYSLKPIPFEFQFISNAVYYENLAAQEDEYILPPSASSCSEDVAGIKPWSLLETHLYNKAYFKRSDVWFYNRNAPVKLTFVDESNINSLSIVDEEYLNRTKNTEDRCIQPATFFQETKDNNLCLCTFWGDNIETWQTHYGRSKSCTHGDQTMEFTKHFQIDFHSREMRNVKLRVFADTAPPYEGLLKDFFVLHAIYIQAIDQLGFPVGVFDRYHWVDSSNIADTKCPHGQFPSPTSIVNQRHPIFKVRSCHDHPRIPEYGVHASTQISNLFIYENIWRDDYDVVCARYEFSKQHYPHVTHIQFLAFLRIEDRNDDGHAYMVEIRSGMLDANDLALGQPVPEPIAKGKFQDETISFPPLNYVYYKNSLFPNSEHYERECVDPVKEPDRTFDGCRHYTTTPFTKDTINRQHRPDVDGLIDKYNHLCGQWIIANQRYGPNHPYTTQLGSKLEGVKPNRDYAIKVKNCFILQAFKSRRKNAWHVRFRVNYTDPYCENFGPSYMKEAALTAYNEEGYPTGRPGGNIEGGGSFELYNHFDTQNENKNEHCADDDIQLTLDDLINNDKMAFHSAKGKCMWVDDQKIDAYKGDKSKFHQDFGTQQQDSNDFVPSMMIWGNFNKLFDGFCAIWFFPVITQQGITPPKHVQFVLEIQIVQMGVNPAASDPRDHRIITIRSPKYLFQYDSTAVKHFLANGKPDILLDSKDRQNLDPSVSLSCHNEEFPIEELKRPNDQCVCELRPKNETNNAKLSPLCVLKYEFYNTQQDSKLYRACLERESIRHTTDFPEDDCRTKLEYPRPPEIFPNEQITLEGSDDGDFGDVVVLEPFDPTEEAYYGCGLIKKCLSPFADDQVEKSCIRDKSCGMIVTFGKGIGETHHPFDEVTMEIYAVARGWAAVGISPNDEYMGEDYVIECAKEGSEVNLYNSWNIQMGQPNKPNKTNLRMRRDQGLSDPKKSPIRPAKLVFYEDKLYCKFYIKKIFSRIDPDFKETHKYNLDELYHYITAYSHALTDPYGEDEGNVRTHIFNGGQSEVGKKKVSGGLRLSPLPPEARKFRLHALFMILAWMFFLTLSIFVARYFKETLLKTKIYQFDFWYFVHCVAGLLAFICVTVAFIFQISGATGWRSLFRSNFHTYSGIVAFCFFVSAFIMGFFMKMKLQPVKPALHWVHSIMGHVSYNLALLNMAFSDRVAFSFLSCNFKTYCLIWMCVYYILHAFMSYHYCWVDYILGRNVIQSIGTFNLITQAPHITVEVYGADKSRFNLRKYRKVKDLEAQREAAANQERFVIKEAPGRYIRLAALVMFTVITCVYTFWAIRKVAHYPKLCYDFYELKHLEEFGFN